MPTSAEERISRYDQYRDIVALIDGGRVEPHWLSDGSRFWYVKERASGKSTWRVDPDAGTKTPVLDVEGLPQEAPRSAPANELPAPDGNVVLLGRDDNLWLRSSVDGREEALTEDGTSEQPWRMRKDQARVSWSPDGTRVAAVQEDTRGVSRLPVVHWLKTVEEVQWQPYTKAGGLRSRIALFVIDRYSRARVRIDLGEEERDIYLHVIGWSADGSELWIARMTRDYHRWDLLVADVRTGQTRIVLTEVSRQVPVEMAWWARRTSVTLLGDTKRFIRRSDRSGWSQLYLYSADGTLIRPLTRGAFPVDEIISVDEANGWVYFTAQGNPFPQEGGAHGRQESPYDTHLYRVSMQGRGLGRLTEGEGEHSIVFSPSKRYFLDTHSSPQRSPRVELRRADGALLQVLENADISRLTAVGWESPEEFEVLADDGKTPLYGLLYKPPQYDPARKYPVIDFIYGGPQMTQVPRAFPGIPVAGGCRSPYAMTYGMAQLGYVVFVLDGRGTPKRGRAFQDVGYGNYGRHEIPDHVAALRQLAARNAYIDLRRAGITGASTGGYMTIRAMVTAPEVYRVGVACVPVSDIFDQYGTSIEPFMGLPQDNPAGYEFGSSLRLADRLQGKLMMVAGTSDVNATLSATMKMSEALIRANKRFDLIVAPEQEHGFRDASARFASEATAEYFNEHLMPLR